MERGLDLLEELSELFRFLRRDAQKITLKTVTEEMRTLAVALGDAEKKLLDLQKTSQASNPEWAENDKTKIRKR